MCACVFFLCMMKQGGGGGGGGNSIGYCTVSSAIVPNLYKKVCDCLLTLSLV